MNLRRLLFVNKTHVGFLFLLRCLCFQFLSMTVSRSLSQTAERLFECNASLESLIDV